MLCDHQPLQLNPDDYNRVCHIPKKKGANFRDLPGVVVGENNRVEWDTAMDRVLLKSGKPLVLCAGLCHEVCQRKINQVSILKCELEFRPFGRLWMDEIVNTVVTRAEPHKQVLFLLFLSWVARMFVWGFPDCYKLFGTIKERYIQVGNAVAVPVAIALGYSFGLACQNLCGDEPLMTLPFKFPNCLARSSQIEGGDSD
ncbi:DNA (cytosine-5)-methyltransferase 1 isoform X2 [Gossypium australe]|uniref:DNA (cytosine-5-)-methyltransferase n=1 Tax=Gossypium australe TaxID=47621 RepID=A0A5B6V8G1_9ROSI|nr:DNA (cytosine-5)-methyltransferase 1 isoform X2 [Gossypium australe]